MNSPRALLVGCLAAGAVLSLPAAATAAEPDLVARFPLDEAGGGTSPGISDPSLAARDLFGAAVPGRFGNALSFAAAGRSGFASGDVQKRYETPSFTVLAWVRAGTAPGKGAKLVMKSGSLDGAPARVCADGAYALRQGTGGVEFAVSTGDGFEPSHATTATPVVPNGKLWDGAWHAIAGSFDAPTKTLRIAVDGALAGSAVAPRSTVDYDLYESRELAVGRFPDGGYQPCNESPYDYHAFRGAVDDVRVYGRALNPAEFAYLQSPAATVPRALPVPEDVPVVSPPPAVDVPSPTPAPVPPTTAPVAAPPTQAPAPAPAPAPVPAPPAATPLQRGAAIVPFSSGAAPNAAMQASLLQLVLLSTSYSNTSGVNRRRSRYDRSTGGFRTTRRNDELLPLLFLTGGLSVDGSAGDDASFGIVGSALVTTTDGGSRSAVRAGAEKKTTQTVTTATMPPIVVPIENGRIASQLPLNQPAVRTLAKQKGITQIGLATQIATIPASAIGSPARLAELQRLTAEYARQSGLVKALLAKQKGKGRKAKANQRTLKAAEKARDAASVAAGKLAYGDFIAAGAGQAPLSVKVLKR